MSEVRIYVGPHLSDNEKYVRLADYAELQKQRDALAEMEKQPQLLKCSTYTRPAPAVSLAELVPERALNGTAPFLRDKEPYYNRGWNDCRAAILHNIEGRNND